MTLGSTAEQIAKLPPEKREEVWKSLTQEQAQEIFYNWRFWARPKQIPPEGDWYVWFLNAGRGFGKTRTGAEWIIERAKEHPGRWMALIARNPADARDYMIEGPGGILTHSPPWFYPKYEPTNRRILWPNGSYATIYSGEEPDQLRGFSGDTAWLDELAKWKQPQYSWDQLQFGMREVSSDRPRILITTTPRPLQFLRDIIQKDSTIVVSGSSYENRSNLDKRWFDETIVEYEGSRFGRQEIHAEILSDVPGALWKRSNLDDNRVKQPPEMERIVVGVDPAISDTENSAETGIIVCGVSKNEDGITEGFTLDDWSMKGTPEEWARKAVGAYHKWEADRIIAEQNQGGLMVQTVIRTADPNIPVKLVTATRGKYIRAEPISALYEQNRVHHLLGLDVLEDQMVECTQESLQDRRTFSPDRVDALVWALSELFGKIVRKPRKEGVRPIKSESSYSILRN